MAETIDRDEQWLAECAASIKQPLTVIETDTSLEIYERNGDSTQFDDRLILVKRKDPQWSNTWGILKRENGSGLTGQEWSLASRSEIQQVIRDAKEFRGDVYDFIKTLGKTDQEILSECEDRGRVR